MLAEDYVASEEFKHDVAWLKKNRKACELAVSKAYENVGRGALVVNSTTESIPGGAYPFRYIP